MADEKPLEKAEAFLKRTLERLGSAVDKKVSHTDAGPGGRRPGLSSRKVSDLVSSLERAIESELKPDENGIRRLAPNRIKVLFTYEERARLTEPYLESLGQEFKATAYEFINNRRYMTSGPIQVEVGTDLFVESTTIKVSFEPESQPSASRTATSTGSKSASETERAIRLFSADGHTFGVGLSAAGPPAYIGRAAGSAVRIDDPSVSRLHASIALRASGEIVLSDLGSANGTWVNGHVVNSSEAHKLEDGDVVTVGDVRLKVVIE